MSAAKTTTNHKEIQKWVEARGGRPARVKRTGRGGDLGLLRIDYPGFAGEQTLEHVSWPEWFEAFDENNLAFLYQDSVSGGSKSRFSKLVERTGKAATGRRGSAARGTVKRSSKTGDGATKSRSPRAAAARTSKRPTAKRSAKKRSTGAATERATTRRSTGKRSSAKRSTAGKRPASQRSRREAED